MKYFLRSFKIRQNLGRKLSLGLWNFPHPKFDESASEIIGAGELIFLAKEMFRAEGKSWNWKEVFIN